MKRLVESSKQDGMLPERIMAKTYQTLAVMNPEFVALDGGAHKAHHTRQLAALPNAVKVFAVEASDTLASALEAMRMPNVEVINAAIQDDPACEEVVFRLSSSHPGRSGITPIWKDDQSVQYIDVRSRATTIDRICAGHKVNFIKLDLEGGEFRALQGATQTLAAGRPWIAFENSNRARKVGGFSQQEFYDFFTANGYALMTFWGEAYTPDNEFSYWYAAAAPVEQRYLVGMTLEDSVRACLPA
jgi:FkbM family methyltransferase